MREHADPGRRARPIPIEDAELIEKVKSGHSEAFGALVQKYQDRVFNTCWRICGNLEDARDLTQEAFLKAFEGLQGFRQESGFYTWLFRVAVNLALTFRRQAAKRRTLTLPQSTVSGTQADDLAKRVSKSAAAEEPARQAGEAEMQRLLVEALHSLDDDHRVVVILRDIEGLDYHEIGSLLEIPEGTVKSRLHRARMALREAILPHLNED